MSSHEMTQTSQLDQETLFRRLAGRASRRIVVGVLLLVGCLAGSLILTAKPAEANFFFRRQYYSGWSYRPATSYHYRRYYYTPSVSTYTHSYHYVIYYPSRPRYYYYYNPVRRVYWGRFEMDEKGKGVGYSKLAREDQKGSLDDIPESAFPKSDGNATDSRVRGR